ncbi:MAG: pantothenate kinase, partial [Clostridiales bacterium]|nr:pantothenate kinase [Clostridiales bacterium]
TAIVLADNEKCLYLGGTGVGGGTLMGLSKMLLNMDNIDNIEELANGGDLKNIDLRLSDITKRDIIPGLPDHLTVSNFGKTSDIANKSDTALGIINLVFETIGMISIFAARQYDIKDIILTGNMTKVPQAKSIFQGLNEMFKINFIIPEMSQYGPVIGAALCHYNDE